MAVVSVLVMVATLAAADFVRQQGITVLHASLTFKALLLVKRAAKSLYRSLVLDFLVSVELCTVAFENGALFEHYGFYVWCTGLVVMTTYQILRWSECDMPTPYIHLLDHLGGSKSLTEATLRTAILMASGMFSYRYVKTIWRLELSSLHVGRPQVLDFCQYPWSHVPMYKAMTAEVVGSFLLGIAPRLVLDNPKLKRANPLYPALIVAAIVAVTVVAALDYSGGMFNPMLASVLVGGCDGHTLVEHLLIYWVGATVGAVLAFMAYPTVELWIFPKMEAKKQT